MAGLLDETASNESANDAIDIDPTYRSHAPATYGLTIGTDGQCL